MNNSDESDKSVDERMAHEKANNPDYYAGTVAENTSHKHTPASNSPYSHHCKIDNRSIADCDVVLVSFDSLSHVTQEHSTGAGAILLEIEEVDTWFPKRLCSNLDLEAGQVRVWSPFMKDKMPELYESIMTYGQEQEEGVRSEGEL